MHVLIKVCGRDVHGLRNHVRNYTYEQVVKFCFVEEY